VPKLVEQTVDNVRQCRILINMLTVVETPLFSKLASDYWTEDDRADFASFIAVNSDSGNVVSGSGGVRKVRWSRQGSGKSGGVRVIYFN